MSAALSPHHEGPLAALFWPQIYYTGLDASVMAKGSSKNAHLHRHPSLMPPRLPLETERVLAVEQRCGVDLWLSNELVEDMELGERCCLMMRVDRLEHAVH